MTAVPGTPPALIITSDADGDALGLVTDPAQRRRAFDSLSPGAGWLLRLPSLSHAALSGTLAPDGWHAQDQHRGGPNGAGGGGGRGEMGGGRAPQGRPVACRAARAVAVPPRRRRPTSARRCA